MGNFLVSVFFIWLIVFICQLSHCGEEYSKVTMTKTTATLWITRYEAGVGREELRATLPLERVSFNENIVDHSKCRIEIPSAESTMYYTVHYTCSELAKMREKAENNVR